MNSVKIGNYQMDTAFGLYLPEYTIPAPTPQTKFINIIGRDGAVDLSNAFGDIHYNSREWTLDFKRSDPVNWLQLSSSVMNAIHGKRLNFTFDDDPNWYWTGRVMVQNYTSKKGEGTLRIKITSDPYKYANLTHIVTSAVPVGEETFTAALVSIDNDQMYMPISLSVPVSPVQDLHGYASPWGPGAGKSKVPVSMTSNDYTAYGINVTVNDDGTITTSGSNTGAGNLSTISNPIFSASDIADKLVDGQTYFFTACPVGGSSSTYRATIRKTTNGSSSYITDTGSGVSFTYDAASTYIAYININQTVDVDGFVWKPMICLNSESDKVWEPYANVCPITGRTGASVNRTGKNLCKVARGWGSAQGIVYTENADGTVHCKGTATGDSFSAGPTTGSASNIDSRCMYTVPAGTYTISNIAGVRIWVQFRNADNTAQIETGASVSVGSSKTFTFEEPTIIYIRSYIATGTAVDADMQVMVTEGSIAATEYEPWQMQTYTANWSTQAGEVYGGTMDVVSGVLTVDMGNIPSYNGETINEPWLSSMDAYAAGTTPTIGAQVVYPLANPVEYQLTPSQIKLLTGQNNIWASNGETITVDVVKPVNVENSGSKSVVPSVMASSDMTLSWDDFSYSMQAGTSFIPQLSLNPGDNYVYVDGTGTISFEYREGSL